MGLYTSTLDISDHYKLQSQTYIRPAAKADVQLSRLLTVDLQCLLVNGQFLLLSVVPA